MDKQFDLVMIVELMEESLVLLAHKLCLPLYQVVTLKKLVRKDEARVSEFILIRKKCKHYELIHHVETQEKLPLDIYQILNGFKYSNIRSTIFGDKNLEVSIIIKSTEGSQR